MRVYAKIILKSSRFHAPPRTPYGRPGSKDGLKFYSRSHPARGAVIALIAARNLIFQLEEIHADC